MTACTVACSTHLPNADRIQHFKDVMEALEGSESLCAWWFFVVVVFVFLFLLLSFSSLLDYLWIHTFVVFLLFIFKALESSKIVCVWLLLLFVCVCVFTASVLY